MTAGPSGRLPKAWARAHALTAQARRRAIALGQRLVAWRQPHTATKLATPSRWRLFSAQVQALGAALLAMLQVGRGGSPAAMTGPPASAADAPRSIPPARVPGLKARLIANPASGGTRGAQWVRELEATALWLTEHGLPTTLCLTSGPASATHLAEEAVRAHVPLVIAAGGDGTINQVVQALAGHTTALGVLPTGDRKSVV